MAELAKSHAIADVIISAFNPGDYVRGISMAD
jgi:hypothetical protein